jgi:hypothetical protein
MSAYIKLSTQEYPRYIGDIEIDPAGMEDYALVEWQDRPSCAETQRLQEGAPQFVDGKWVMTWQTREATQSEILRASTPRPNDEKDYYWDETTMAWVEQTFL